MPYSTYIISIVGVPVIGAFLLPLASRVSKGLRNGLALLCVIIPLIASIAALSLAKNAPLVTMLSGFPLGFNFVFCLDRLAVFMAIVSGLVSAVIIIFSFDYISHYEHQSEYYCMVVLFFGAMMGLVFAANLILLYIFWEITAIASWRLIGFFRSPRDVEKANKAFLMTMLGAVLMLLGFIMIYQQAGSFDLAVIKQKAHIMTFSNVAIALILAGIFSKSATLPFSTWLPDAGVAPAPVTALLHAAVLVKIGVYVYARLFIATFPVGFFWHSVVPWVAGVSALVSAGAALIDTDFKRIVAYSTISQIGFIFLGLSTGNTIGIVGGLLYILMHGLAKAGLFLCAGIVEQNTKTKDITKLGGLIKGMPFTAIGFLFCAFSVMGIPPFGGFFSKYLVFSGSLNAGSLAVTIVFLLGAFLTILYLLRLFAMVFLGENKIKAIESSKTMVGSVLALGLLSIAAGIFVYYPMAYATSAVQAMLGVL